MPKYEISRSSDASLLSVSLSSGLVQFLSMKIHSDFVAPLIRAAVPVILLVTMAISTNDKLKQVASFPVSMMAQEGGSLDMFMQPK